MRQAVVFLGVLALVMGVAASAHAQQGQGNANAQQKKQKRQPNQVPESGSDQSEALAADTMFERAVDSVPVTVQGDGTTVVELTTRSWKRRRRRSARTDRSITITSPACSEPVRSCNARRRTAPPSSVACGSGRVSQQRHVSLL